MTTLAVLPRPPPSSQIDLSDVAWLHLVRQEEAKPTSRHPFSSGSLARNARSCQTRMSSSMGNRDCESSRPGVIGAVGEGGKGLEELGVERTRSAVQA